MNGFETRLDDALRLMQATRNDPALLAEARAFAQDLAETLRRGGKAMACGNGGSMADAMHFAEELTGRFKADRAPLAALAFSDPTHLTCVANDYGFEHVFSRMVTALGKPGDMVILLSTSGNSPNLLAAAKAAREAGVSSVAFLGKGGGQLRELCDRALVVPGETSDRIQEIHMHLLHVAIELVEQELGLA